MTADRNGIYRVMRFVRRDARAGGGRMSSSVLTWGTDPGSTPQLASERLRLLERSHHAMWNYLTYRDAIGIVGLDPARAVPGRHDAPGSRRRGPTSAG